MHIYVPKPSKGVIPMPEYSKDEWQRMIERYSRDMMAQYAAAATETSEDVPPAQAEVAPESEPIEEPDFTAEEANEEDDPNNPEELTDVGQLQVRVSTENQAVPIPGAVITVTRRQENGENALIRTMIADDNGLTPIIDLPTKDRGLSLVPGNQAPFAVYTVDVTADGYFPKRFIDMPIYGGVIAIQSVSMIPLPEEGGNDIVLSYPQSGPSL